MTVYGYDPSDPVAPVFRIDDGTDSVPTPESIVRDGLPEDYPDVIYFEHFTSRERHLQVVDALRSDPHPLIDWAVKRLAQLGSMEDWYDVDHAYSGPLRDLANACGLPDIALSENIEFWKDVLAAINA